MTTPEIIDQIHELIFEDRRISSKSIAEQLGISYERVGFIIFEDLDMRMLYAKWSRNVWMRIKNINGASRLSKFWNFSATSKWFPVRLVTMEETWLYQYDLETTQQSMEWRLSGSPRLKNFREENTLENFSPRFFGIKTASSSLIIFKTDKLSTRSITHLCWCNWSTFWRKNAAGREGHQSGLVLVQ